MHARAIIVGCLISLSVPACAFPEPSTEVRGASVLPLEPCVLPTVRGHVSGRGSGRFVIDTGATATVLDEADAAGSFGLVLHRYLVPRFVRGGNGHDTITHYADRQALVLGSATIRCSEIPVLDLHAIVAEASVVVGEDVLRRLVMLFAPAPRQVSILSPAEDLASRLARAAPRACWTPLRFRWEGGLPIIDLELAAAHRVPMLIDTGAEFSMITTAVRRDLGLSVPAGQFHLAGSIGGGYDGALYGLPAWRLGGWEVETVFAENQTLDYGVLGFDILGAIPFAFDGPGATLWLAAPNDASETRLVTSTAKLCQLMRKFAQDLELQDRATGD
ncbi:MAG: pepsin/retropepsin-like aspartic protease family protein [Planctomycetota bacterium]